MSDTSEALVFALLAIFYAGFIQAIGGTYEIPLLSWAGILIISMVGVIAAALFIVDVKGE